MGFSAPQKIWQASSWRTPSRALIISGAPKAPFQHSRGPRRKLAALQDTVRHLCPGVQFYIFLLMKMHSQLCNSHTQCHMSTHNLLTI